MPFHTANFRRLFTATPQAETVPLKVVELMKKMVSNREDAHFKSFFLRFQPYLPSNTIICVPLNTEEKHLLTSRSLPHNWNKTLSH